MDRDRFLAAVSAVQLAVGIAGMAVALERRHAYDFLFLHGRTEKVARDSLGMGTALSAPGVMLVAQGVAVAGLVRQSRGPWQVMLGGLGAVMVPGYLGESLVRRRLHASSWDRVESPLALTGIGLAAVMAALGLSSRHRLAGARSVTRFA